MISKKTTILLLWPLSVLAVFGLGLFLGTSSMPAKEKICALQETEFSEQEKADFSLFWDVWALIEEKYVERQDLDPQAMVYGAVAGLVDSLSDPYSVFMPPQQAEKFREDLKGSFEGIGAEISKKDRILTVVAPLKDSPAEKAGLRSGDIIIAVDEVLVADLSIDEAVSLIRGDKGTQVVLSVLHQGAADTEEIKIIRDVIKLPVLEWEKRDNIVYIELYQFTETSQELFTKAAYEILAQPDVSGLVLDLRNNPGGYLEVAVDIASWFVPKSEIIAYEDFGNGQKQEYRSRGHNLLEKYPLVIIVNQGSASASEILAGALRDLRGIQLVGVKTFGKGSVQTLETMAGNSSLKLTVAKWLTPSLLSIQENGLEPDIKVDFTNDEAEAGQDPQLEKALQVLNSEFRINN